MKQFTPPTRRNALGHTFTSIYDPLGRAVASQTPLNLRTTQVFDAAGRSVATIDPAGYRWTTIYDPASRPIASETPLGFRTTTTFDAANRPIAVQNPRGYRTTTVFDAANQPISIQNPLGHERQFQYDLDSRQTTLINEAGGVVTMVFDRRGAMLGIANELDQRTSYTFDPVGNTRTRQFANGDVTTYTYDPLNRETNRQYADNSRVTMVHDPVGNLTTIISALGTATNVYDAIGQNTVATDEYGVSMESTFDAVGQRVELSTSGASSQLNTYEFDADGRVIVTTDISKRSVETQYDPRGFKALVSFAGGREQVFDHNADGHLILIADSVDETLAQEFVYTYDPNGNRATIADLNGALTTFTYDPKDRLTQEATAGTNAHTFNYTWDSRDNMLTHNETGVTTTMTFDVASRIASCVRGTTSITFVYDLNGNVIEVQEPTEQWEMLWDKENRLIEQSEVQSERLFNFLYDPFSRKKWEYEDGGIIQQLYWLDDMYIGEGSYGALTKAFIQSGGVLIGEVEDVDGQNNTNYYLVDALGSVTGESDESNTVWNTRRLTPLGRVLAGAAVPQFAPAWAGANNYRHTGLSYANYYMWHRHFDSASGRWISRDVLWPEESAYGYVNGNPVRWIDAEGKLSSFPPAPPKPVRPGPPIPSMRNCDDFQLYVSRYCAWCRRNPSNHCRWECDRLARRYKEDCNKLQVTPGMYEPGWDVRVPWPPGCEVRPPFYGPPKPKPSRPPRTGGGGAGTYNPPSFGGDNPNQTITWCGFAGNCHNTIGGEECRLCCKRSCKKADGYSFGNLNSCFSWCYDNKPPLGYLPY